MLFHINQPQTYKGSSFCVGMDVRYAHLQESILSRLQSQHGRCLVFQDNHIILANQAKIANGVIDARKKISIIIVQPQMCLSFQVSPATSDSCAGRKTTWLWQLRTNCELPLQECKSTRHVQLQNLQIDHHSTITRVQCEPPLLLFIYILYLMSLIRNQ